MRHPVWSDSQLATEFYYEHCVIPKVIKRIKAKAEKECTANTKANNDASLIEDCAELIHQRILIFSQSRSPD